MHSNDTFENDTNNLTSNMFLRENYEQEFNTLHEPIKDTLMRDIHSVATKFKYVLLPKCQQENGKALKDWDLWGPLLVGLSICVMVYFQLEYATEIIVAIQKENAIENADQNGKTNQNNINVTNGNSAADGKYSSHVEHLKDAEYYKYDSNKLVFSLMYFILIIGSMVVTLNAKLLGIPVNFLQYLSVLGYCLFPFSIVTFVAFFIPSSLKFIKVILSAMAIYLSSNNSANFLASVIPDEKKIVTILPIFIFYTFVATLVCLV